MGKKGYVEVICIVIVGIFVIFGFMQVMGVLFSGYHFVDDHEIVRYQYAMNHGQTLWQVLGANIRNDLSWRYRPFYWVERTIGAYFLGTEMPLWNIYTAIKGVAAFCLLYFSARNVKCDWKFGLLFSGFIMFGQQITPLYRSANQESTGLLLCAVAMWMITWQMKEKKYEHLAGNIFFCIAVILSGLTKESFTLYMPAFLAAKFWAEYCEEDEQAEKNRFWVCLKRNIWVYAVVSVSFFYNVYNILFRVGVDNVSYAGFHQGTPVRFYLRWVYENLFTYTRPYTFLSGYVLAAWIVLWKKNPEKKKEEIRKYAGFILINLCAMGIQLVSHAQSRIWGRYLFPYMISYAVLMILISGRYFQKRKLSGLYAAMILLFLMGQMVVAKDEARSWMRDGKYVAGFLECLEEHVDRDGRILCAFRAEELNVAVESKVEADGWKGLLSYRFTGEIVDLVGISAQEWDEPYWISADAAVCYGSDEEQVKKLMDSGEEGNENPYETDYRYKYEYEVYQFGDYSILIRKK